MSRRKLTVREREIRDKLGIVSVYPLSPDEKTLCRELAIHGEDYLREVRPDWDIEKRSDFLSKKSVQYEIAYLTESFNKRDDIGEKVAFFAQKETFKMVPFALRILQRQLVGETTDPTTGEVTNVPPTREQYTAALSVIDMTGVKRSWTEKTFGIGGDVNVQMNSVSFATEGVDKDDLDEVTKRERIRNLLSVVLSKVNKAEKAMDSGKGKIKTPTAIIEAEAVKSGLLDERDL